MKNRIKTVRKENKLTQTEFGERIGVKGNTITNYETGLRNPTDAVILSICREFSVNEEWLRNGTGEPYKKKTREQEIAEFLNDVMEETEDNYKKRFILAMSKLSQKEWEIIAKITDEMSKEG